MSSTVEVKCEHCKKLFTARVADRKRGWAKFCSKSCKAFKQEQITGQCGKYYARKEYRNSVAYLEDDAHPFSSEALGQE